MTGGATLQQWIGEYLRWMGEKNYAPATIKHRKKLLDSFWKWCEERSVHRPQDLTRQSVERYRSHIHRHRLPDGRLMSMGAQYQRLFAVMGLCRWLCRKNVILYNPASELELPKLEKRLPRNVLTTKEVEQVLAEPDTTTTLGLRNRAMLETLYSTGIRREELSRLSIWDVDLERHTVMVREGKGRKDRIIPIGERACCWIEKYLQEARPEMVRDPTVDGLFLSYRGRAISASNLSSLTKRLLRRACIRKKGACHMFRHTMATLMLDNGADIRHIQEMLGHDHLSSTQIYTHVSIEKLKEVHAATHPGAKLARKKASKEQPAQDAAADPAIEPASETAEEPTEDNPNPPAEPKR
jgi:integrase/recombinase XerD